jgi:superfamily II DNA or RNA helicase
VASPNLCFMAVLADLLTQLDPDPGQRGKQFEHICKWFLTNDPVYKHELRRVWLWDEWLGRWGGDAGIDLVAEDRTGHLWAIQAKAYAPNYRVTKRDVNKFLAESGREIFTYRMLIATTNLIDRIGERTIQDQEKRVTFFRLNDLQAADVDWPAVPTALRPARPRKPASPHDYQREAIKKVIKGFTLADRGQLIMACGTGKTLTALFITENLEATRTLVLLPSVSLLKQTLNVWRANCTTEFASLPVCSDDTVAMADDDVAVAHTSDLGVPVTTDPEVIAAFLRQRSGPQVVFATYQSSPQIAKAFTLRRVPGFDLVIADEAHRCAGPVSSDFATVLDPLEIKSKRRLFMTATPRYFTGRILRAAQDADYEIASMDDETKFGTVFHRLTFGEAISRDLLTDYQVAIIGVDNDTYREWAERGAFVTLDGVEVSDAATLAGQIGLAKAMRKYALHRMISFHSRIKRAREFAASLPEVLEWMPARQRPKGELWSRYASGQMPAGDRYVLLQHLGRLDDGDLRLLANARCLAEGVDVPTLDGVAFIDPRKSEVDIVQAVGRAIRKSENKTVGTVVIPVFINTDEDPEIALSSSVFQPVWDVIKGLRAHDEELAEQLDSLRRAMGRKGSRPRLPDKIHIDIPAKVGTDFVNAFDVRLVEQTTASWEFWFGLLEHYVTDNGTSRVPSEYSVDDYCLGRWVIKQRARRNAGKLSPDRERRLACLPGWIWNTAITQWEEGFSHLSNYAERHGHTLIPAQYKEAGYRLGQWVSVQRSSHAAGTLDSDREQRLQQLTGWTWTPTADRWETGFDHLLKYVEQHGDARVPGSYILDGYKLGQWVGVQRTMQSAGDLDAARKQRLQQLPGWTWNPTRDRWETGFDHLLKYVEQEGDTLVPGSYILDGFRLGTWVATQRHSYGEGTLDSSWIHRLEELPGWAWNTIDSRWEKGFRYLLRFIDHNGHAVVPQACVVDGYPLGKWVNKQRVEYARHTLKPERQQRLERLSSWSWNPKAGQWETGFVKLLEYVEKQGNARVPKSYKFGGYNLGAWVDNHRQRRNLLDENQRRRLEAVPGWSWDPWADQWEEAFTRLLTFGRSNGHSRVPAAYRAEDGYRLGQWVSVQRANHQKGSLDTSRERRLEELPGWTWRAR